MYIMATTLRTRRMRARGIPNHLIAAWANRKFIGIGNRATLTTSLAGSNNDITLLAKTPGMDGNSITFRIVVSGNNTPLSVSVSGSAITVNSATNGSAAATSTAQQVIDALNANADVQALVWAQRPDTDDGTGVVTALTATNLSGAA